MRPFKYTRATEVNAAAGAVSANPHARFLAGGTNLLDLMKRMSSVLTSWWISPG